MRLVAIVDDDEAGRESVKDLLDDAGFSTAAFASAESLLQSGQLHNVACLVTDPCMPGMSGLELHLRLMASNLRIPAILVTGCNDERVRAQAFDANVAAYLPKPVQFGELLACIRSAMQEWQAGAATRDAAPATECGRRVDCQAHSFALVADSAGAFTREILDTTH